ncbi:hypothetical protein HYS03_01495 [Candidatus Woesebacteria bacterium]|nr:hypothetical protein [Candidatus Woesebacteria bacterium]QQG47941.1 MAG: hypothetical protein HY044_02540 [Candidatus Woesebacteria bacterium]
MKKFLPLLVPVLAVLSLILVLLVLPKNETSKNQTQVDSIQITDQKTGTKMTFTRDGFVEYQNGSITKTQIWDPAKIASFFEYIQKNLNSATGENVLLTINGQTSSGSLGSNDELINTVINQISGGGGNGGGNQSFFSTSTPVPAGSGSGSSNQTPSPGAPSWCIHWRLSYCADQMAPPPTSTPVPGGAINATDCSQWNSQSSSQTTLSDSNCNKTTPTPNSNPYGY